MKKPKTRDAMSKASDLVIKTAHEILEEIIAPVVGINGVWADVFQAEPSLYVSNQRRKASEQRKKIITKVARRYNAQEYALAHVWRQPLALFALVAMSKSNYMRSDGKDKKRRLTANDAWEYLDYQDKRLARLARERKRGATP